MRWVLIILALLVYIVAGIAVVGAVMPEKHVASRTVRFRQPPETVWQAIADYASSPSWRPELRDVQQLPDKDGHPVWRETDRRGRILTLEILESTPPRRLIRRIVDSKLPFGGSWTIEIATLDGGSVVTVTENGEIYNPFFRFLTRYVFGYTSTIDNYLTALGNKFGEDVHPGE